MNQLSTFHSFAPSQDVSPKTIKQSTNASLDIYKFSIHLPTNLLPSQTQSITQQDNIKVYCRLRPTHHQTTIKYDNNMIDDGENTYIFDRVFGKLSTQQELFDGIASRHISDFFIGHNSTIFAYGQTGSGKTYTMFGEFHKKQQNGIIPRTLHQIFKHDLTNSVITCSMLQIYNEKIMDLLNPYQSVDIKLKQLPNATFLQGLIEVSVENEQQLMNLIKLGHKSRKVAMTFTNDASSRSHTVLFLYRNYQCQNMDNRCKLCFIDLAGSQKIRKSGAQGQTLQQAKKINSSLSSLGNVIHALTNGSEHIPYRNSKLTRILKDSLGGYNKTSIITTCSLNRSDHLQTISTIKFAVRAKKIKNKQKIKPKQLSINNQVNGLIKQINTMKQKYDQVQKELAFYKNKQYQDKILNIDDIPEESNNYQPLRSICRSGGMSSRNKLFQSSLKTQ